MIFVVVVVALRISHVHVMYFDYIYPSISSRPISLLTSASTIPSQLPCAWMKGSLRSMVILCRGCNPEGNWRSLPTPHQVPQTRAGFHGPRFIHAGFLSWLDLGFVVWACTDGLSSRPQACWISALSLLDPPHPHPPACDFLSSASNWKLFRKELYAPQLPKHHIEPLWLSGSPEVEPTSQISSWKGSQGNCPRGSHPSCVSYCKGASFWHFKNYFKIISNLTVLLS